VIFAGKRLIKANDVLAFEKSVSKRSDELRRKMRIGARAYHTHLYLRPQLRRLPARDKFKYTSRKHIRWFGGLFMLVGGLSVLAAAAALSWQLAAGLLVVAALLALLFARARAGWRAGIWEVVLATVSTFVGVAKGLSGQTVATWTPAKSR
jgi:hypothetical protein